MSASEFGCSTFVFSAGFSSCIRLPLSLPSKLVARNSKMKETRHFLQSCRSTVAALLSAGATCWACAGERVFVPAWLTLANYLSLLLYVLLLFERVTEVIFHLAACLLPAFVYVLLALLISLLSLPPESSPGAVIHDAGAGVGAGQQAPTQQLLRSPVVRTVPTAADVSATVTRNSVCEMEELSSLKKSRRRISTSRRYPFVTARAASLLASGRADGRVSVAHAGFNRIVPQYQNGGYGRSSLRHVNRTHSNIFLALGGLSTRFSRMRRSSNGTPQKQQLKKHLADLVTATDISPGYTRRRHFDSGTGNWDRLHPTNAEVGEGGSSGRITRAATADTVATERTTSTSDAQARFPTAGEATERKDRIRGMDGVAGGASHQPTKTTGAQQSVHAGANEAVDIARAGTVTETGSAAEEEEEEEGRESEEGGGGGTWLAALMTCGYMVVSHIGQFLLLELPVYSFALYLCHVLRIQGISFSAGPNSTQAAAEEVAAYRRVLLSSAGDHAFPAPQSNTPAHTGGASSHISSGLRHGASTTSGTNSTIDTMRCSDGMSRRRLNHSGAYAKNSSLCNRRQLSDDSWRAGRSQEGINSRPVPLVKTGDVSGLCSSEFRRSEDVRTHSKWQREDLPACTVAADATEDNRGYSGATCMAVEAGTPAVPEGAGAAVDHAGTDFDGVKGKAELLATRSSRVERVLHAGGEKATYSKALVRRCCTSMRGYDSTSAAAQGIKHVWRSEEPHPTQRDEYSEGWVISWNASEDCSPSFMSNAGVHLDSQTLSGNAAGDNSGPAAGGRTAVGAAAVGVTRGSAGAECATQRKREATAVTRGSDRIAETPSAAEIHLREENAECAAVEGLEEAYASAGDQRQTTVAAAAAETQFASSNLPAMEKEVVTMEMRAGVTTTTAWPAPAGAGAQNRQLHISRESVLPADAPEAEPEREAVAGWVPSRPSMPKPSAAAQSFSTGADACAVVESSENDTVAARVCSTDTDHWATAVREGTAEPLGGWEQGSLGNELQWRGRAVPTVGSGGCSVSLLPPVAKDSKDVFVDRSCGHSNGGGVLTQCSLENSDTMTNSSNSNVVGTAGVAQVETRKTCTAGIRGLTESCCGTSAQGCKRIGCVSSSEPAQGGALSACAADAVAGMSEVENEATRTAGRTDAPHRLPLLLWSLVKLQSSLRSKMRGVLWFHSYGLTADVAARRVQSVLLSVGFQGELLRVLHPFRLLSLSPIRFFPNTSQRLIFTTCCFWLLRGLHGDIFSERRASPSAGTPSSSGISIGGWADSDAMSSEPSRSAANNGSTGAASVTMPNSRDGSRNGSHAHRRRDVLLWGEGRVRPGILSIFAGNGSTSVSSSFLLYSTGARNPRSTFGTRRDAIRIEPSAFFLEKNTVLVSGTGRRHSRSKPARKTGSGLTRSSYEEYVNWVVYAFLLKPFTHAGEYLQSLRQWTAWLALLLLLLQLISYSLLSLSSTYENLPWQLLHVLVVLRHTRLCTYAEHLGKQRKHHLLEKMRREGGRRVSDAVRKQQDVDEKEHDKWPLQVPPQAQNRVDSYVVCPSGQQPKGEDGVDEEKVSS